jgi:hypothetical protein
MVFPLHRVPVCPSPPNSLGCGTSKVYGWKAGIDERWYGDERVEQVRNSVYVAINCAAHSITEENMQGYHRSCHI